jgi:hypothetical protein
MCIESGTFETNGPCPATHPVKIPQLFYETIWDTTGFNDKSLWPEDGSQPFVWSFGDRLVPFYFSSPIHLSFLPPSSRSFIYPKMDGMVSRFCMLM